MCQIVQDVGILGIYFREQLKAANEGSDVTEEELYQFLKHFHLLNYDH
jgi:hypothetical protein